MFFSISVLEIFRYRRVNKESQVPDDIRVEAVSNCQLGELNRLKAWLYQQKVKVRQERDRADRRREREKAERQREAEQSVLFEF